MAHARDDFTAAVNTALKAKSGTGFCHAVELQFGQPIRQKPGATAGVGDTAVEWETSGEGLQVYTSVDDERSWQRVFTSGDPIPYRAQDDQIKPLPAGMATTKRRISARILFTGNAVVTSFTLRVVLEDGSIIERVETGSELADGTLIGCAVTDNALRPTPDVYMRFLGNRGAATREINPVHDDDGAPFGLHLSHGEARVTYAGPPGWELQGFTPSRFELAAMAFEGWIYPTSPAGIILAWGANQAVARLQLVETPESTARLEFFVRSAQSAFAPTRLRIPGSGPTYTLRSPNGSVRMNRWQHVAFSYDGLWATLYLNGLVVSHFSLVEPNAKFEDPVTKQKIISGIVVPTEFSSFIMGRHHTPSANTASTEHSYTGLLSEWRFYNRRLTAGTIIQYSGRRLHAAEITARKENEGLVAYYPMNEGTGQVAVDHSGNDLHLEWNQIQVGGVPLPPQLGWQPSGAERWRGYATEQSEVNVETISEQWFPGRQTLPLDIDITPGNVLRVCDAPYNITFPDGRMFQGVGGAGGINPIQEAGDLMPTGVELRLSGMNPQNISVAMNARYLDRPARVYQVTFDSDGEMLDPFLLFDGRMDQMDVQLGKTGTVQITAESALRNWRRPKALRWNDESHRRNYGSDRGFQYVAQMEDLDVWWPARPNDASPGDS